jgi:cell fate regulator YaaT (PSP1 superfamily)
MPAHEKIGPCQDRNLQDDTFQDFLTVEQRRAMVAGILGDIALRILGSDD